MLRTSIFPFYFPISLLVARLLAEFNGNIHLLSAPVHGDIDSIAGTMMIEHQTHVELIRDFLAVNGHDDIPADVKTSHPCQDCAITAADTSFRRGPPFRGNLNQQAFLNGQVQRFRKPSRKSQGLNTEECAMHASRGDQIVSDGLSGINRNGET